MIKKIGFQKLPEFLGISPGEALKKKKDRKKRGQYA